MKPKQALNLQLALVLIANAFASNLAHADAPAADTSQIVTGNTAFALDLYAHLRAREGNLSFSPYSISTALALASGGARGDTEKQIAQTLHFNLPPDQLHPAFAALAADLTAIQQKKQVQLTVANSLWPQAGFAFLPAYLDLCQKEYHTTITPVDYIGQTETARTTVNTWVEDKTSQKIVELLKPGVLTPSTRLVLVNAIYFKGNWVSQFKPQFTSVEPFHVTAEKSVTAHLMRQTGTFPYAAFADLQMLELPYVGKDLSLLVLLPLQPQGLAHVETELTAQNLALWFTHLASTEIKVSLPKFKVTSHFSLAGTLQALGMTDACNPDRADFSGMDGKHDLYISDVIHQAFVEVNEEGTEAAAATATVMLAGGVAKPPPIPSFRADHPFLFLIRDNHNGAILFLGRVTDPAK